MSPGELVGVEPPTLIVTTVKASTDAEVQSALGSSTDDITTTGAPVEKVCIYLFFSPAGDRECRWSFVGQPLGSRSNTAICGDAESRTAAWVRDILRARRRPEFRRLHRTFSIVLGHHSTVCAWCDYREPIALGVYCMLILFFLFWSSRAALLHRTCELFPRTVWRRGSVS